MKLKQKLFSGLLNLDVKVLDDKNFDREEFIKLFTNDSENLVFFMNFVFYSIQFLIAYIVGNFLFLFINIELGLISIFIFPFLILFTYSIMQILTYDDSVSKKNFLFNSIKNIRLVIFYKLQKTIINYLSIDSEEEIIKGKNNLLKFALVFALSYFIYYLSYSIIFYIGFLFFQKKIIGINGFILIYFVIMEILNILNVAVKHSIEIDTSLSSFNRINRFLNRGVIKNKIIRKKKLKSSEIERKLNTEEEKKALIELPQKNENNLVKFKGKIEFKKVYFSYNSSEILKGISFVIKPNQIVSFIGMSGIGKSTIIQLILGFYDADSGDIFIDDINIKNIDLETLRNSISGVYQDIDLFSESIKNNIISQNMSIDKDQFEKICSLCCIPKELLDDKKKTKINQISGGEKQRIGIARSLVKKSSILFFDEATSALDPNTDSILSNNLFDYLKNDNFVNERQTVIFIAHR